MVFLLIPKWLAIMAAVAIVASIALKIVEVYYTRKLLRLNSKIAKKKR